MVFAGGAIGTGLRYGMALAWPDGPLATLFVNLTGAFALGWLLGAIGRHADPRATHRRLFLGTGLLGAYTTYSAFVVALAGPGADALDWAAAIASLPLGVLLAGAGLRLGHPDA